MELLDGLRLSSMEGFSETETWTQSASSKCTGGNQWFHQTRLWQNQVRRVFKQNIYIYILAKHHVGKNHSCLSHFSSPSNSAESYPFSGIADEQHNSTWFHRQSLWCRQWDPQSPCLYQISLTNKQELPSAKKPRSKLESPGETWWNVWKRPEYLLTSRMLKGGSGTMTGAKFFLMLWSIVIYDICI